MIDVLKELEDVIKEFNQYNNENLDIDSIRIEFNKSTSRLEILNSLGNWKKVNKNDKQIMKHIKTSYLDIQVTNVHRLDKHNIYYYNLPDPPKYRKAIMVIFGLKQYHKEPPPRDIINTIIATLKDVSNLDVCKDFEYVLSIENLKRNLKVKRYREPITKILTNTHYINNPLDSNQLLKKVVIYDKAEKNKLDGVMWRVEANISLSKIKDKKSALWLSLNHFRDDILKLVEV